MLDNVTQHAVQLLGCTLGSAACVLRARAMQEGCPKCLVKPLVTRPYVRYKPHEPRPQDVSAACAVNFAGHATRMSLVLWRDMP